MKRLRLSYNYHDAQLRRAEFGDRQVTLEVDLAMGAGTRHLFFGGVRNLDDVRTLLGAGYGQATVPVDGEIVGIGRTDHRKIMIDLAMVSSGASVELLIDCDHYAET